MNLRSYYPDFVALDSSGQHWLIETKGMESSEVSQKDAAAANWCENASQLTEKPWRYMKVPQKGFESYSPGILRTLRRCVSDYFLCKVAVVGIVTGFLNAPAAQRTLPPAAGSPQPGNRVCLLDVPSSAP
jgi:hypothetical protein